MTTMSETPSGTLDDPRLAVQALSLPTKVGLLTGQTMWRLRAIDDIGLRSLTFSDGPVGVRGLGETPGETSRLFPTPSGIAAAWDPELAHEVGRAFAVEARSHGVDVVLAPQINIQRTPVAGRHFECFSEDPFLTAAIGTSVVRGIQSEGVGACVKHFIANDSETDRTTYTSRVPIRALREVYLAPFEDAVAAGVWSVMAAYNQAEYAGESAPMTEHWALLIGLLKSELGFDGVVVSDWVATLALAVRQLRSRPRVETLVPQTRGWRVSRRAWQRNPSTAPGPAPRGVPPAHRRGGRDRGRSFVRHSPTFRRARHPACGIHPRRTVTRCRVRTCGRRGRNREWVFAARRMHAAPESG